MSSDRVRSDLVGVALAGGQSRRMGRDKALMPLPGYRDGVDLVSWTVERLSSLGIEVIVADRGRCLVPGLTSIPDGPGRGPAAGILGAAAARPGQRLLVLACDLPLVPTSFLERLISHDGEWVAPSSPEGHLEPLCAVYSPAALAKLASRVEKSLLSLQGLAADIPVQRLEPDVWQGENETYSIFLNVNKPEDFDQLAAVRQNRLRAGSTAGRIRLHTIERKIKRKTE